MESLKLVLKENKEKTKIKVDKETISQDTFTWIAGPCAVESYEQMSTIATFLSRLGIKFLRGGAFKPRSNPYSFQGLGEKGLQILKKVKKETGMGIVTEIMDSKDIKMMIKYADILQVGARNMQNFSLLKELGKIDKPILLKRGLSSTAAEFLASAEYILKEGNPNIILCERGIRTFEDYMRFTLNLGIVPYLKNITHLPIIVDPSHAAGTPELIKPLSKAAIAAGCDGLIIEVHNNPSKALSDAKQALTFDQFSEIFKESKPYIQLSKK